MTQVHKGDRAIIYCRISRDRAGESLGVQRQESECRELCERSRWRVVDVLVDNDVSAYSGKRRPGYEKLLETISSGAVDLVVAWNTDRLHRRLAELVTYTDVCAKAGVTTHTVRTGPIDLSTPSGILVAQQLGAVAEYESRNRSARVRAAKDQSAAAGKYQGGSRGFGFEKDGVTLRESEARWIRKATRDVIRDVSLSAIAREWREAGVKGVDGADPSASGVRYVLMRPRNAGLREHRGVIVGKAVWDPIVSPEDFYRCLKILKDPERKVSPGTAPRYLGAMRYRCGATLPDGTECGAPMKVTRSGPTRFRIQVYICTRRPKQGVKHVTIKRELVDEYVVDKLLAGMLEQGVGPASEGSDGLSALDARQELADVTEALEALLSEFTAGRVPAKSFAASNEVLSARLEEARDRVNNATQYDEIRSVLSGFEEDPRGTWDALPVDMQRDLLDRYVRVTVLPASSRSRWHEGLSARVRLDWNFNDH